jgi:two-component system, cell cycle response regulator
MDGAPPRIILVDASALSREVMVRRLGAQGYAVEATDDAVVGADMALSSPPAAVIADLWMPNISGIQLCRLLKAEPATAEVPVILRGESDDPRSLFWTERSGAAAYVKKGRTGELVRVLSKAVKIDSDGDAFFMQLSGSGIDIRDRIARYLDVALFESVVAAEVRSLAASGSFDRLFDLFAQFVCQVIGYRWLAVSTTAPARFAIHVHPRYAEEAEREARAAVGLGENTAALRVVDEDAREVGSGPAPIVKAIPFGTTTLGKLALAPIGQTATDCDALVQLVARELGGPIRIADLMDEQQRLASTDPLTGLRNRRAFVESVKVEVERAGRYRTGLSLLLLDVDHFKAINDRFGHAGGDQVLSTLGRILGEQLRIPDLAARWGGEEFVLALPNTGLDGACVLAERVRDVVGSTCVAYEDAMIPMSVSVGVATLRRGESLDSLIDRADRAMYCAKQGGRNRVERADSTVPTGTEVRPAAEDEIQA